jgi:hypothetical protein
MWHVPVTAIFKLIKSKLRKCVCSYKGKKYFKRNICGPWDKMKNITFYHSLKNKDQLNLAIYILNSFRITYICIQIEKKIQKTNEKAEIYILQPRVVFIWP